MASLIHRLRQNIATKSAIGNVIFKTG